MKHILIPAMLLIASMSLIAPQASAQKLSKQEKKEWDKRKKALKPLEFKKYVEERDALQKKVNSTDSDVQGLKTQILAKEDEISGLKGTVQRLERENSELDVTRKSEKGVVFRVQIGAYEGFDISDYSKDKGDLNIEKEGKVTKYTLGYFTDYWEADKFKKYVRAMGLKDAWIVAYRDGKRVDVKDVLEGVI